MSRTTTVAVAFALAAIAWPVGVAIRGRWGGPEREAPREATGPPGVVVLCLDTLRADALSLGSGRPVGMPRLERLASQAVVFADAVAPSAWTAPSVTSMLTGLEPDRTGVVGLIESVGELASSVDPLPAYLARFGYDCAAVVPGGWVDRKSRFLAGCREVAEELDGHPEARIGQWGASRRPDTPFCLYLHSVAPHDPYLDDGGTEPSPAERHEERRRAARIAAEARPGGAWIRDEDARWLYERTLCSRVAWNRLAEDLGPVAFRHVTNALIRWIDDGAERDPELGRLGARLRAAYTRGLAHADAIVGRILDALAACHLPEDTVVIVVSDHGEAFGEHGTVSHGRRLYDELLRVPFVVLAPTRAGAPRIVRGAAGLVDLMPTVLDLVGAPVPPGLDGISLLPALEDGTPLPDRAMRSVDDRARWVHGRRVVERLECVRTTRTKCLLRRNPATRAILGAEVFDLVADPGELRPIAFDDAGPPCMAGTAYALAVRRLGLAAACLDAAPVLPASLAPR